MGKGPFIAGGIFVGVGLLVMIILLAISFSKIDATEVGLLYSHASFKIDRSRMYTTGRYYVGVAGEFITFPITVQELALPPFDARTQDGLKLSLEVGLNFKVENSLDTLLMIYDMFGRYYDGFLSRMAMNIVRDASARSTAFQYAMNRSVVNKDMEADLRDDMAIYGFDLDSLQLLNIHFPPNFSVTLQNTLMLQQQVQQVMLEKEAEIVAMRGEVSKASTTSQGILADARTQATSITQNAEAAAASLIFDLQQEGMSHKDIKLELFADSEEKFVDWYWLTKLQSSTAQKNMAISIPATLDTV